MAVLTVGLSADVADHACVNQQAPVDASFTCLRHRTLTNIITLSGSAARAVLSEMMSDALRL